jgi:hypothetical protein
MADMNDMGQEGTPGDAPDAPAPSADTDKNIVMLSADHFPEGVTPKKGDKLTFCVTEDADSSGNVSGYFDASASPASGGDEWVDDFKKSMSPVSPQAESA